MELIAGSLNASFLESLVYKHIDECAEVIAIVPYCDTPELFEICKKSNKSVKFYCRLDHTVPVKSEVLKWFLKQNNLNYKCYVLRGGLHAKIIWFKGIGAYIGSANLTDNGWVSNIEAGLFVLEDEPISNEVFDELEELAEIVHLKSTELSEPILKFVTQLEEKRRNFSSHESDLSKWFNENCSISEKDILPKGRDRNERKELKKSEFIEEWNETLDLLNQISEKLKEHKPKWVNESVTKGVHLDQFLHAYYYSEVREGNEQPYKKHYINNQGNPEGALIQAMMWWKRQGFLKSESEFMHEWAPKNHDLLQKNRISKLSENEFVELCCHVHAIVAYGIRQKSKLLGISEGHHDALVRVQAFGRWLYKQRTKEGKTVLETISFVLYGGETDRLPLRIWSALNDPKWKIDRFGVSSIGELVGWALPDKFPPRNSRTSKTLRALGNKVKVHSERDS
jgi:hypothetical protein